MWWFALAALADEGGFNTEPLFRAGLVWQPGEAHPFGAVAGVGLLYALGDHCSWSEDDCRGSALWPLAGPLVEIDWRGGERFGTSLVALVGGGRVDMHQFGFFPVTTGFVSVGGRLGVDTGPALDLGVELQQGLSVNQRVSEFGVHTWGVPFLQLTGHGRATWGRDGWSGLRVDFGLQGTVLGSDYS